MRRTGIVTLAAYLLHAAACVLWAAAAGGDFFPLWFDALLLYALTLPLVPAVLSVLFLLVAVGTAGRRSGAVGWVCAGLGLVVLLIYAGSWFGLLDSAAIYGAFAGALLIWGCRIGQGIAGRVRRRDR